MTNVCQESHYQQCGELRNTSAAYASGSAVPMQNDGGVFAVSVLVNDALTVNFIVDSGATDVSIPADIVSTLVRTNTLSNADFLGTRVYTLADGSKTPSKTFRIRSLKVGNLTLENVIGSIAMSAAFRCSVKVFSSVSSHGQ